MPDQDSQTSLNSAFFNSRSSESSPTNLTSSTDPTQSINFTDQTDFNQVLYSFEDIQADLNYRQARSAIRELVDKLDLSDRERYGLERELQGLEWTLNKLETAIVQIAVFGLVGRGKSSLLNALIGQPRFKTGALHGVTQTLQRVAWQPEQETAWQPEQQSQILNSGLPNSGSPTPKKSPEKSQKPNFNRVSLPGLGTSRIELVDTPGLDEIAGHDRAILAQQIAKESDLILFVISGDMTQIELTALTQIREAGKPILLVFNKVDRFPDADRQAIYDQVKNHRVRDLLTPDQIVMTAASPLIPHAIQRSDGSLGVELKPGAPQVEALKLKILEILHREGKSLVALNSLLYADSVHERIMQRKLSIREHSANQIIWRSVMGKALAIALNPVTILDLLGAATFDVWMLVTLSKLYGIPLTETGAIELLKNIAIGMGGISASELLTNLGLSSLKSFLGAVTPLTGGLALSGYTAVALTQAGTAGVATYAIGQVAKCYFENGASWGENSPKVIVSQILATLDETSILAKIRQELQEKILRSDTSNTTETSPLD